jgi:hypothetical protein
MPAVMAMPDAATSVAAIMIRRGGADGRSR